MVSKLKLTEARKRVIENTEKVMTEKMVLVEYMEKQALLIPEENRGQTTAVIEKMKGEIKDNENFLANF